MPATSMICAAKLKPAIGTARGLAQILAEQESLDEALAVLDGFVRAGWWTVGWHYID